MARETRSRKTALNLGLPAGSVTYFEQLAREARAAAGTPWADAAPSPAYLRKLEAAGLICTGNQAGRTYAAFTTRGVRVAARLGIDLTRDYPEFKVNYRSEATRARSTNPKGTTMSEPTTRKRTAKAAPAKAAKAAPAKAAKAAPAAEAKIANPTQGHPGYETVWTRRGGVFAKNVSATDGAAWLVICDHGTAHDAERTGTGDGGTRAVLADRASWCKSCAADAKAADAAPAKAAPAKAAAKAAPAKVSAAAARKAAASEPVTRKVTARDKARKADAEKLAAAKAPARKSRALRSVK